MSERDGWCRCGGHILDSDDPETCGELECADCGVGYTRKCHLCERAISEQEAPALCVYCEGVAKAHARLDAATAEWVADGRPD